MKTDYSQNDYSDELGYTWLHVLAGIVGLFFWIVLFTGPSEFTNSMIEFFIDYIIPIGVGFFAIFGLIKFMNN
jgi:hypothetical protein